MAFSVAMAHGQSRRAVRQQESAQLTQEQRLVKASKNKGRSGTKKQSMKKKVKLDQREDRRARRIKKRPR